MLLLGAQCMQKLHAMAMMKTAMLKNLLRNLVSALHKNRNGLSGNFWEQAGHRQIILLIRSRSKQPHAMPQHCLGWTEGFNCGIAIYGKVLGTNCWKIWWLPFLNLLSWFVIAAGIIGNFLPVDEPCGNFTQGVIGPLKWIRYCFFKLSTMHLWNKGKILEDMPFHLPLTDRNNNFIN